MRIPETNQIELKEKFVPELKKDVVAFANTDGDGISPDVTLFTQFDYVQENGKTAIKISIGSGTKQPYYLRDKGMKPSGVYIRQGTSSVPASEDAIRKMIKESEDDSYER